MTKYRWIGDQVRCPAIKEGWIDKIFTNDRQIRNWVGKKEHTVRGVYVKNPSAGAQGDE